MELFKWRLFKRRPKPVIRTLKPRIVPPKPRILGGYGKPAAVRGWAKQPGIRREVNEIHALLAQEKQIARRSIKMESRADDQLDKINAELAGLEKYDNPVKRAWILARINEELKILETDFVARLRQSERIGDATVLEIENEIKALKERIRVK